MAKSKEYAEIFIWWDEYDRQDMPCRCLRCGNKKAKWVKWRFETRIYKDGRNYRRYRTTTIPMCLEHAGNFFLINASDFNHAGVWTMNVHKSFRTAIKDYRKSEVAAWQEENPDADPDDFDDEKLPPGLRTVPKDKRQPLARINVGWGTMITVLVILVAIPMLLILIGGCLTVGSVVLGVAMKR